MCRQSERKEHGRAEEETTHIECIEKTAVHSVDDGDDGFNLHATRFNFLVATAPVAGTLVSTLHPPREPWRHLALECSSMTHHLTYERVHDSRPNSPRTTPNGSKTP